MTAVLLDLRPTPEPEAPEPAQDALAALRRHRTTEAEDLCAACGWHWPCPAYFQARHTLIQVGVPPCEWASLGTADSLSSRTSSSSVGTRLGLSEGEGIGTPGGQCFSW
jgi:hypothetical protein